MTDLVFAAPDLDSLTTALRHPSLETAAVLLASVVGRPGDGPRLLVREVVHPGTGDYRVRTSVHLELEPAFVARVVSTARLERRALVFAHSHPWERGVPRFSGVDDAGEAGLAPYLARRVGDGPHGALLVGADRCVARVLGGGEGIRVVQVGAQVEVAFDPGEPAADAYESQFDRQVRAFGQEGQQRIAGMRVAIVGLGGTGSVVAQQLAYLGVRRFLLVDPDIVEATNLNRIVGAVPGSVGRAKVEVAAAYLRTVRPDAEIEEVRGGVHYAAVGKRLAEADFLLGCTDSHGSRAVMGQLAYQYLVPCIDLGVAIVVRDSRVTHVSGRVQMLAPGLGCFACGGLLDGDEVRRDLMSEDERRSDPYFLGGGAPQPAVVSVNSMMSSLAVTMFLAATTGAPLASRLQLYDGVTGRVRSAVLAPRSGCIVCSPAGALARGDEWPLPARHS